MMKTEEPLTFIFETNREYRKSEALFAREVSRSTLVIGFEEEKQTVQLDGDWSRPEGKTIITSDGTVTVAGKVLEE